MKKKNIIASIFDKDSAFNFGFTETDEEIEKNLIEAVAAHQNGGNNLIYDKWVKELDLTGEKLPDKNEIYENYVTVTAIYFSYQLMFEKQQKYELCTLLKYNRELTNEAVKRILTELYKDKEPETVLKFLHDQCYTKIYAND